MNKGAIEDSLSKVGILRGPGLNPYEWQCFTKLPKYRFQPIGITTYDNSFLKNEIPFPVRVGHNFKTVTNGKLSRLQHFATKITNYNFESWNYRIIGLKNLTSDLDIIYSADTWFPYTCQAIKTGIPTLVMEWENIPFNYEGVPYSKIKNYNREHATHFVAITEKAKEALIIEGVNPNRISVIPSGLDCDRFKPAGINSQVAKKLNISSDSIKILFVGRLVPEKGIFDLLNAFSILQKKVPTAELLIVGSGPSEIQAQIMQLIARHQIKNIKFLGKIPYSEMPKIHNLVDIFCLPSIPVKTWAEQFGYSMVEAMACGKPVISTLSGSIPEVVKDNKTGVLVHPKAPLELASALEELTLDKQKRENFGKNAREWVLQEFEANKVAGKLAAVFCRFL